MQVQRSFKDQTKQGKLYLVPTPIGNLEDMTFRAITILKTVDLICAEDTRNTGLLLKHFDISTKQVSFHEHNAREKIPFLLSLLQKGQSLAQVSDAGMPSISDPGHDLVKAAIKEGIPVISLPGASAGITGLIASGLMPQPHIFYGFLPRKKGAKSTFLESKKHYPETQIFYESPYRVVETLEQIRAVYGERQIVLVRELTKLYEEYQRASISELIDYVTTHPLKGECLLVVAGYDASQMSDTKSEDPMLLIEHYLKAGHKPNQAIKAAAKELGMSRQELYQRYHNL